MPWSVMVKACLRLDPPHPLKAFLYAEEGRSRLLRDQLGALPLPSPRGVPETIVAMEQQLLRQLRSLQNPFSDDLHGPGQRRVIEQISDTREKLEAIWETLRRKHFAEDYVALRRGEHIDWDDVQRWLNDQPRRVAVLEFYTLDDALVAFIIRPGDSTPVALPLHVPVKQLEEMAQRFVGTIRGFSERHSGTLESDKQPEPLPEAWQEWAPAMLNPIMPHLKAVDILYLIPHGVLHHLPLHALDYSGKPLIEYVPVAYAPSIAVAMRVSGHVEQATPNSIARASNDLVVGNPTGDLQFAEQEATEIAQSFGVEPLLGRAATTQCVQQSLAGAVRTHLATHAFFAQGDPFASGIVLADGTLTAREIMAQSINTQLMVLSACQTGVQDVRVGDELVGLARALLYVGVPTLVLSLWRVNDPATKNLMLRFYTHLYDRNGTKQMSTAEALQATIRETRQESADIYFWAPFILFGNWQ